MLTNTCFETERLRFRLWAKEDEEHFIAMGQDIEGMNFFSRPYTPEESQCKMYEHIYFIEEHGYGFWAVEEKESKEFIGTIGFNYPSISSFFTPCLQMGWCLRKKFWGQGYATEGAKGALSYLKEHSDIPEVYSYTHKDNKPSLRVLDKVCTECLGLFVPLGGDANNPEDQYIAYKSVL